MTDCAVGREDISFVQVSVNDFEDLLLIRIEAMHEVLKHVGAIHANYSCDSFEREFSATHARHIVVSGMRVGFLIVKPTTTGWLLEHLYVRSSLQRQGIGSAVLAKIVADADATRMSLRIRSLRGSPSNRLFLRHGFELESEEGWLVYFLHSCEARSGDLPAAMLPAIAPVAPTDQTVAPVRVI